MNVLHVFRVACSECYFVFACSSSQLWQTLPQLLFELTALSVSWQHCKETHQLSAMWGPFRDLVTFWASWIGWPPVNFSYARMMPTRHSATDFACRKQISFNLMDFDDTFLAMLNRKPSICISTYMYTSVCRMLCIYCVIHIYMCVWICIHMCVNMCR
jgi:hypothetical protein